MNVIFTSTTAMIKCVSQITRLSWFSYYQGSDMKYHGNPWLLNNTIPWYTMALHWHFLLGQAYHSIYSTSSMFCNAFITKHTTLMAYLIVPFTLCAFLIKHVRRCSMQLEKCALGIYNWRIMPTKHSQTPQPTVTKLCHILYKRWLMYYYKASFIT